MSVAFATCWLFIRDPAGGTEDLQSMQHAGFTAVAVNVGDFPPERWQTIRSRALSLSMQCWPWRRVDGDLPGVYYPERVQMLCDLADSWGTALVVNCEKGLDGTRGEVTQDIARRVGHREAAMSTEATPFSTTDWGPVARYPVLPQLNVESGHTDINAVAGLWRAWGFKCVFPTFGTYGGRLPTDYRLQAPYNLYTADDCHEDYDAWRPTSSGYQGCLETPEDDMQLIGNQDGVVAEYNVYRDLAPTKTLLKKDASGKWPSIDTLVDVPIDQWKALDKGQRTKQILVDDHDEVASAQAATITRKET